MSWIQTYTGRAFYPLEPVPEDIDIRDIAHALAMLCRFGGHSRRFYSVAEHSVHVSRYVGREIALWGLLHDASEAYLVDVPRPIKHQLPAYREAESRLMACIATRFGLPGGMPDEIADVDGRILIAERDQLLSKPPIPWSYEPEPIPLNVQCWGPRRAKREFLSRFVELVAKHGAT